MLSIAPFLPIATMPPSAYDPLIASAQGLKRAALAGQLRPLLRGKNVALLCEAPDGADGTLFQRAASELGAHVALVRPSVSSLTSVKSVQDTARMLGRLYDAIECQGVPSTIVEQIRRDAGVPVFDGLASPNHHCASLAGLFDDGEADNHHYLVQASLVNAIG